MEILALVSEEVIYIKNLLTLNALKGNRTYLAGYGLMSYAVLGYILGQLTLEQAIPVFLNGAAVAGIRAAMEE